MRDIELWHRIDAGDVSPEIIEAIVRLTADGLSARASLIPRLAPWLEATNPTQRRVAVALHGGCTGMLGLRRIVAALDDDDESVRDAAVSALAESCATEAMRWAHALFHRRADVRRFAAARTPDAAKVLLAWARADPELDAWTATAPWPTEPIALVHDLWLRGRISPSVAVAGIAGIPVATLREFFTRTEFRGPASCAAFVRTAIGGSTLPPTPGSDALETWLEIAVLANEAGSPLFGVLTDVTHATELPELRPRLLVATCAVAHRHGWNDELALAAFDAEPRWIAFDFVPASIRRKALQRVWNLGAAIVRPPQAIVDDALSGELACDEAGQPSLANAAALALLLPSRRCWGILDSFSEDRAVALSADDLPGWYAVTRLPAETAHLWWLRRIEAAWPDRAAVCRALLCLAWIHQNDARAMSEAGPLRTDPLALLRGLLEIAATPSLRIDATEAEVLLDAIWEPVARTPLAEWLPGALRRAPVRGTVATLLGRMLGLSAAAFGDAVMVAGEVALDDAIGWIENVLAPTPSDLLALAAAWREAKPPRVVAFVTRVLRPEAPPPAPRAPIDGAYRITAAEAERIASCSADELDAALAAAYRAPSIGLTAALAQRRHETASLSVTAALIGCADGLVAVARELARYASDDDAFIDDVRHATLTLWGGEQDAVPPLVDATLVAFERHAEAFAAWFQSEDGSWPQVLEDALDLRSKLATRLVWEAIGEVLTSWAWREKRRVGRDYIGAVVAVCVAQLDTVLGPSAARILTALRRADVGRSELDRARSRIVGLAPAMTLQTHRALASWISLAGIAPRDRPGRRLLDSLPADERYEIEHTSDVARLVRAVEEGTDTAGASAIARLVEIGSLGQLALARALARPLRHADLAIDTIPRWTDAEALAEARRITTRDDVGVEQRFRVAVALVRRGGPAEVDEALAVARDPRAHSVASTNDWDVLEERAGDRRTFVAAAARCRDPLLANRAMTWLTTEAEPWVLDELRAALYDDGGADDAVRRAAAVRLWRSGDECALALVLQWTITADVPVGEAQDVIARSLGKAPWADALADLALVGGSPVVTEQRVVELLTVVPRSERDPALARILLDGVEPAPRKRIVEDRITAPGRDLKLVALAKTFAWGVVRGRELTGRRFSIHMTPKREQWGFTHMGGTAIHVTPVPILSRARHGQDIVEGLILHEIGHHIWHGDKPAIRVWKRSSKENLHQLLNLVADEHLERNLRSIDAEFGDRIKRLDAAAFQHAAREIEVVELLRMLRGGALEILAEIRPAVAYDPKCLRIDSGRLLAQLDAAGHSFARFVRALRMGLGNRAGDPKVDTALGYFGAGFRQLDMHGLYRVTKALAALFGTEALLAHGFGGHESVGWDQRESDIASDGIIDSDVQREVERILEPPRGQSRPMGQGGHLAINVGANEAYKKIKKVQPVAPRPEVHKSLASTVGRHADRLRETLERLGLGHRPETGRLRGHALDRSRLRSVVLRGDPRMLRARELHVESDLFLGVVVDCSGSMSGANLDRARRFAVLVAEAARGLTGVDARFFGFTDDVIWDAGDARKCAVAALEASGGNNDAAALDHVASVGAKSHRRSKLIVMISDGLPTECSVAALRGVVRELTRRHHICCAQVAVRPLSEICFPHYVLLDDENMDASVRRFAVLIARLVGRALTM